MEYRNIIVIGASAGGFDAIKALVNNLPTDLEAAVFIVWHMSPDVNGILPEVLSRMQKLPASHAIDGEPIKMGHIYVATPDHHLLLEKDTIRVTRGPKENRFRPAIDPLFRSASYAFGARVIGVVLSGALDDGSAGLWTIKQGGGLAIVQDPDDAEVSAMPENALRAVKADYQVPVAEIGQLLSKLVKEPLPEPVLKDRAEIEKERHEVGAALEQGDISSNILAFGELSPYTCPECHGVLTQLREGNLIRFRCHTGHAYSLDTLLLSLTENIEANLYSAIRGMQESIMLLNHTGDHYAEVNLPKLAALYFKKAQEAEQRVQLVQKAVFSHEQFSDDSLRDQVTRENDHPLTG